MRKPIVTWLRVWNYYVPHALIVLLKGQHILFANLVDKKQKKIKYKIKLHTSIISNNESL